VRRPIVPDYCTHNAHMYYLLLSGLSQRTHFIEQMRRAGVGTDFHYVPLHSAPAGLKYGRAATTMEVTDTTASSLVRLPVWVGLESEQDRVIDAALSALESG